MEHLVHENFYTSVSVFCGKVRFISKQPEKSGQGVQNYKLVERRTQLHVQLLGLSRESHQFLLIAKHLLFPLQVETNKVDLKMPMISLLSKHTYFRKEDAWRQLEGICLIMKINIYTEIQLLL